MTDVPRKADPLQRAHRIQEQVSEVGFDWSEPMGAWRKVAEELEEVREELDALRRATAAGTGGGDRPDPENEADAIRARLDEELGDLLFSVVNLARLAGARASTALDAANRKFTARFEALEALAEERGVVMGEASLEALDALWEELKAARRRPEPPSEGEARSG